eukprot:3940743-Rhodomonas_salina.3
MPRMLEYRTITDLTSSTFPTSHLSTTGRTSSPQSAGRSDLLEDSSTTLSAPSLIKAAATSLPKYPRPPLITYTPSSVTSGGCVITTLPMFFASFRYSKASTTLWIGKHVDGSCGTPNAIAASNSPLNRPGASAINASIAIVLYVTSGSSSETSSFDQMPSLPISQKCPPALSAASECWMNPPDRLLSTTSTCLYSSMLSLKASASLEDAIILTPSDRR